MTHDTHDPRPNWHDCRECDRVSALERTFGAFLTGYASDPEPERPAESYTDGWANGQNTAARTLLDLWVKLGGFVPGDEATGPDAAV